MISTKFTHTQLLAASVIIGSIADSSRWYSLQLAEEITNRDIDVRDMTIGELVFLINNKEFDDDVPAFLREQAE